MSHLTKHYKLTNATEELQNGSLISPKYMYDNIHMDPLFYHENHKKDSKKQEKKKKNLRKRAIITIKIFCFAFTTNTATTREKAKPLVFSTHNR